MKQLSVKAQTILDQVKLDPKNELYAVKSANAGWICKVNGRPPSGDDNLEAINELVHGGYLKILTRTDSEMTLILI